jgi:hypothetical protein
MVPRSFSAPTGGLPNADHDSRLRPGDDGGKEIFGTGV